MRIDRRLSSRLWLLCIVFLAGCEDADEPEERDRPFVAGQRALLEAEVPLYPGPAPGERLVRTANPFEGDARALAEGQRLWTWFNCNGCHGTRGGGGIAPPMADGTMIYGRSPGVIFQSIVQGRPNGMPAFGAMLADRNIWELVTYVQAILRDEVPRAHGRMERETRIGEWEEGMLDARRLYPDPERDPESAVEMEDDERDEEGEGEGTGGGGGEGTGGAGAAGRDGAPRDLEAG